MSPREKTAEVAVKVTYEVLTCGGCGGESRAPNAEEIAQAATAEEPYRSFGPYHFIEGWGRLSFPLGPGGRVQPGEHTYLCPGCGNAALEHVRGRKP